MVISGVRSMLLLVSEELLKSVLVCCTNDEVALSSEAGIFFQLAMVNMYMD